MSGNTGRDDYDALLRFAQVPANEPRFLLRGQDQLGADVVRDWAARAYAAGVPVAVVEQALQQADKMEAWGRHKAPDADHLKPHARKRLEEQFRRRAWNAGIGARPSLELALAHQRGMSERDGLARTLFQVLREADFAIGFVIGATSANGPQPDKDIHDRMVGFRKGACATVIERFEKAMTPLRAEAFDV